MTLAQRHPPLALATAALLLAQKWSSVGVFQLRQLEDLCAEMVQASDICSAERALFFALLGCELDVLRPERLPLAGRSTAVAAFLHMATLGAAPRRVRSATPSPTRRRAPVPVPVQSPPTSTSRARARPRAARRGKRVSRPTCASTSACAGCAYAPRPRGARVAMLSRAADFIRLAAPRAREDQSDAGGANAGAEEDAAVDHRRAVEKRRKRVQRVRETGATSTGRQGFQDRRAVPADDQSAAHAR